MAHRPRILPSTLTSGERRVLAAFLAGRLSAGRLQAELAEARRPRPQAELPEARRPQPQAPPDEARRPGPQAPAPASAGLRAA
jgi:hypothetical protein